MKAINKWTVTAMMLYIAFLAVKAMFAPPLLTRDTVSGLILFTLITLTTRYILGGNRPGVEDVGRYVVPMINSAYILVLCISLFWFCCLVTLPSPKLPEVVTTVLVMMFSMNILVLTNIEPKAHPNGCAPSIQNYSLSDIFLLASSINLAAASLPPKPNDKPRARANVPTKPIINTSTILGVTPICNNTAKPAKM